MENILFLACFLGTPLLALLALLWLAARAIRARMAFGSALGDGWEVATDGQLRDRLPGFPPLDAGGRVTVDRIAKRTTAVGDVFVARYRHVSRGLPETRQGRRESWLVFPVDSHLPRAVVQAKTGGMLEAAAIRVASSVGAAELTEDALNPAWSWAIVRGAGSEEFFDARRGAELRPLLKPPRRLWLHERVAVLSGPEADFVERLEDAEERVAELRHALS